MPEFFEPDQSDQSEKQQPSGSGDQSESTEKGFKEYISWTAPSRPFRKKDRSYYTTIAILVFLLILISILAQEFILVAVLLSLAFVAYVLGFVPPEEVTYKISTSGVTIEDHFYIWHDLDSFWFSEKEGSKVLYVLTHLRFPGQLILVLDGTDQEKIKQIMVKHLSFHEIAPKSIIDSWANALQKHFPLENPHK